MKKNIKNRLQNYGLWIAFISFLALLLDLTPEHLQIIEYFLMVLVAAGIVNDPATDNHGYGDD